MENTNSGYLLRFSILPFVRRQNAEDKVARVASAVDVQRRRLCYLRNLGQVLFAARQEGASLWNLRKTNGFSYR